MESVRHEPLTLVMQTTDPHLGLQLRKIGNQEVVKQNKQTKTRKEKETTWEVAHFRVKKSPKAPILVFYMDLVSY